MDFQTLRFCNPQALHDASSAYWRTSRDFGVWSDSWDKTVIQQTEQSWQGATAQKAVDQLRQTGQQTVAGVSILQHISDALEQGATDLARYQQQLDQVIQQAEQSGLTVDPDGTVAPTQVPQTYEEQLAVEQLVEAVGAAFEKILADATRWDVTVSATLQQLADAAVQQVAGAGGDGGARFGAPAGTP